MNAEIPSAATGCPRFTALLSSTPRGVRLARRLAAERLDAWGFPYETEAHRTAVLLVAELSANAMLHGRVKGRDFRVRLLLGADEVTLRIETTDARPERRPPAPGTLPPAPVDAECGRGLLLVEALSERWGTEGGDACTKTVWCEVVLK